MADGGGVLPICHRNLRGSPDAPNGARLAPWVGQPWLPAFQICLTCAVTGPERFKGGLAPSAPRTGRGLSRTGSNGRYAIGAAIIARFGPPVPGTSRAVRFRQAVRRTVRRSVRR